MCILADVFIHHLPNFCIDLWIMSSVGLQFTGFSDLRVGFVRKMDPAMKTFSRAANLKLFL